MCRTHICVCQRRRFRHPSRDQIDSGYRGTACKTTLQHWLFLQALLLPAASKVTLAEQRLLGNQLWFKYTRSSRKQIFLCFCLCDTTSSNHKIIFSFFVDTLYVCIPVNNSNSAWKSSKPRFLNVDALCRFPTPTFCVSSKRELLSTTTPTTPTTAGHPWFGVLGPENSDAHALCSSSTTLYSPQFPKCAVQIFS